MEYMEKYCTPSRIFLIALLSFIVGIFVAPYYSAIWLYCYIIGSLLFLLIFVVPRYRRIFTFLLFYFLVFLVGAWRYQSVVPVINEGHIGFYNDIGEEFVIEGSVDAEPDMRVEVVKLQIANLKLQIIDQKVPNYSITQLRGVNGKILLDMPRHTDIEYGDVVRFTAVLETPFESEEFCGNCSS